MTDVFIISEENLRQFTDINNNVDSKLLKNAVRESQDIEIQRILGTKLYNKILVRYDSHPDNTVCKMNDIIFDNGSLGKFQLGNLQIEINSLQEYQNNLIKI